MKRLLIVDALNNFIRNYVVMPHLSKNGDPIGGIVGFLLSLQKIARETRPDEIIIAWDGQGGSLRRKQAVKSYKQGRNPLRLNRSVRAMTEKDEEENKLWQQLTLFALLNQTPMIQLIAENVEADDIVSYACKHEKYREWQKVIVSSDKDFYQLLDDQTVILRPIQNEVVNKKKVIEEYEIHPNNFAIARAMVGDTSDNLPGISGVGMPTVAKRFPFLKEEKSYLFDDLVEYSRNLEKKYKIHEQLESNKDLVTLNYQVMQLSSPMISYETTKLFNQAIQNPVLDFNATEFRKQMLKDGFGEVNLSDLFTLFNKIVRVGKEDS